MNDDDNVKTASAKTVAQRLSDLSAEQRALFELKLTKLRVAHAAVNGVPRATRGDSAPLSFAQQRIWFLHELTPDSVPYNQPEALRWVGELDLNALQLALDGLVARHEILRTVIVERNGDPVQVVQAPRQVTLPVMDLRHLPDSRRGAEADRLLKELTTRRFDLRQDLMLRAAVARLQSKEHVLLLVTHHIASDAWSRGLLRREISVLYNAVASGKPPDLKPLALQYADFAIWQRQRLQGEKLARHLSYWKARLAGTAALQWPADKPRPALQTYNGGGRHFLLPQELSTKLKEFSGREEATIFMTLLAAFQILLRRHSGQSDIAVGCPVTIRTQPELENLIGFFVNTLVFRGDLSADPTFRGYLAQVKQTALEAYEHRDLPFEKLVGELKPDRDLSRHPLFQVMFQVRNEPREPLEIAGARIERFDFETGIAKFDLSLSIDEDAGGRITGSWEYNSDLFEPATIGGLTAHFRELLAALVAAPDEPISRINFLPPEERRQLLADWNDTRTAYPRDKCVHELFAEQAERTPGSTALVFGDQSLTYDALNRRANQLAHYLRSLRVGPDVPVGIFMEPGVDMLVAVLGILKADGAYVPLDPKYPNERLRFMVADCGMPIILTEKRLMERLPTYDRRIAVISVDADSERLTATSDCNPVQRSGALNLAYIIYTSGSTGRSKGVLISHQGLVNHTLAVKAVRKVSPADCQPQLASLSFDVSAAEIFPVWLSGATLVVPSESWLEFQAFNRFLEKERFSILSLPTAYWHDWVADFLRSPSRLPDSLRLVVVGTEAASPRHLDQWEKLAGNRVSWCNAYGPTEASITSTVYGPMTAFKERPPGPVPIGRPLPNVRVYLLDRHLNPVPVGVAGEIHIGGDGIARGYLNRPDLTAENFVPDPHAGEAGARLYKTGDLARYLADGSIVFLGRLDHQLKIHGFRIEPAEIEAVLRQHPRVRDAVVVARDSVTADCGGAAKRLVAYVTADAESAPNVSELYAHARTMLPEYMIPSAYVVLDRLPLNANGKVDRNALPALDPKRPDLGQVFVAPGTEMEHAIAGIWAELLLLETIGIHDNFFELGGHSLLAMQVMSRIRDVFRADLPLRSLFENPTINGLALALTRSRAEVMKSDELVRMISCVESLSDDEAHLLLEHESNLSGNR
jgi:amino acid adenylation domain-containing protein